MKTQRVIELSESQTVGQKEIESQMKSLQDQLQEKDGLLTDLTNKLENAGTTSSEFQKQSESKMETIIKENKELSKKTEELIQQLDQAKQGSEGEVSTLTAQF